MARPEGAREGDTMDRRLRLASGLAATVVVGSAAVFISGAAGVGSPGTVVSGQRAVDATVPTQTREVLVELLGMDDAEVEALRAEGIV